MRGQRTNSLGAQSREAWFCFQPSGWGVDAVQDLGQHLVRGQMLWQRLCKPPHGELDWVRRCVHMHLPSYALALMRHLPKAIGTGTARLETTRCTFEVLGAYVPKCCAQLRVMGLMDVIPDLKI